MKPSEAGFASRIGSLVVCADDFGLHEGVDEAVIALAGLRRLHATSCLVDGTTFRARAAELARCRAAGLGVGLHLNLTEALPTSALAMPLRDVIARAYWGGLHAEAVSSEVERQWRLFEDVMGFGPDHVDGHQHVHQLPVVREAVWAAIARRGTQPWLRSSLPRFSHRARAEGVAGAAKAHVIGALGGRRFAQGCAARGLSTNTRLLGLYNFAPRTFGDRVPQWLLAAHAGDLLMCHPATHATGADAIGGARTGEYEVLASEPFGRALAQARARLDAQT